MSQQPTVGRIVHYQSHGTPGGEYLPEPRAAIITKVFTPVPGDGEQTVSLCVLNPEGMYFLRAARFSEDPKPGHWSWPPRVGGA